MVVDFIMTGVSLWWTQMVLAAIVGMVAFYLGPPLSQLVDAVPYGPDDFSTSVARAYQGWARNLAGGWLLIIRSHRGVTLRGAQFDPERGTGMWETQIGGEKKAFNDPLGAMGTWRGVPFGIADEEKGIILDPPRIDVGNQLAELADDGRMHITETVHETYQGQPIDRTRHWVNGIAPIDTDGGLIDVHGGRAIIQGDASPGVVESVETMVEQMHSLYNSSPTAQYLILLGSLFAGGGFIWFLLKMGSTLDPGAGSSLPSAGLAIMPVIGV